MEAIINGKIVTPTTILEDKILIIANGKIKEITNDLPTGVDVIDAKGLIVAPGFIDVHIHGSAGFDVMDGTAEAITGIAQNIAKYGTTSFLPTTMTSERGSVYQALSLIRNLQGEKFGGAEVLGAHFEGPFINVKYKGAQNENYIIEPDYQWITDFADVIKIITYAPEKDFNFEFTTKVKDETDIVLSIGHSDANYDFAVRAIVEGCSHITHLFNAMTGLHHRNPGVVGAALTQDVFTEVIADKIHIDENLFQFILDNKTADKVVLITDAMRAGGMPDGVYDLGGQTVHVENGAARLTDGTLAGSVLTLNQAVRNFYTHTNATLPEVIKMASLNPAKSIRIDERKGSLENGKDADIILLDDNFDCYLTMVGGKIIYQR